MNKENYIMADQYKRIQAATLKVLNKNYCIYKGVNTIGRNKTAIINLKHLNVSQQHAVIMIVDNSQHFISDLNSSNGTYLLGTKLSPYKLYELTNDVELKFGDVIATYSKVKDFNSTIHLEMEDADLTQNMTQNFYGVTTQLINESSLNQTKADRVSETSNTDLENIHEAVTQVVVYPTVITRKLILNSDKTNYSPQISDNNIHDALTQVVDHLVTPTTSATILDNDEETEVVFREPDKDVNHELIKTVDDRKTSSSTVLQDVNKKDEENNIHELPTQVVRWPEELKSKNTCDDTEKSRSDVLINDSFVQLQKKSNVSRIDESVIEESVLEEKTKTNENSNDSVDFLTLQQPFSTDNKNYDQENSDKVSNFPESQDIGQPRKKPVRKLSSSEDLTQPDNGKIYNSDSETDLEDDIEIHKNVKKPLIDSDSDTDIEEGGLPGTTSKVLDSGSETDMEDNKPCDDSLTQTQSVIKPKILTKKSILESDSETAIEEDKDKEPLKVAQNEDTNTTEILNDTDCIPATQDAFAEIFMYKDSKISKSTSSQNVSSEESFRLGLTELMVESVEHKAKEGTKSVNVENRTCNMNLIGDSEDQLSINKVEEKVISLNEETKKVVEENEPDEMYLLATQKIDTNISKDTFPKHDPYDESTQKLNINNENISQPQGKKSIVSIMPIQKLNQDETKKTDTEEEVPEDFYIMSTQKLEPDHEPQFKTPQKKFNFRKKGAVLEGSLSNIFSNNEDDLYMAATQQINYKEEKSEDFYLLATQKLNEEKNDLQMQAQQNEDFYMASTQKIHMDLPNVNKIPESVSEKEINMIPEKSIASKDTAEKVEDCYVAPTEPMKFNVNNEKPIDAADTDLYMQETQDLQVTKNVTPTNNEKIEDICDTPTQQINTDNDRENKEKGLYVVETEQLNLNPSTEPSTSQVLQKQDLYMNETEPINLNLTSNNKEEHRYMADTEQINLESNKNNDEDPYIIPTQKLEENKKPLTSKSTVGTKRPVKTNSDTSQAKKIKKASDVEVETLSQIDAFIKESKPTKEPIRNEKNKSSKILEEETSSTVDQSETLSQIQRFVAEPFHNMKKLKTVPKREVIQKNLPKEVGPATSTQSDTIKEPINNTEENKSGTSNLNLQRENMSEEKFKVFQKPEKYSDRASRSKSNQSQTKTHVSKEDCLVVNKLVVADLNISNKTITSLLDRYKDTAKSDEKKTHVSKEDCIVLNKLVVPDLNISNETNTSSSYREQDTTKSDGEKSFALLEAKSTKTRKSQRLNNAAEVKLTVCKNRRSMTTAAIPETSKDIPVNKPATRKTRRKSTNINNNNLTSITENTETTVGGSKRKLESIKSSEVFEAEKPSKVQKTNKIKKEEQKEIYELSSPATSKQKANSKKNSGLDNNGSSDSTISTISTPSRRGKRTKKEEQKEVIELSSPSTSKQKAKPKKDSGHDLNKDGSSNSTISTISTPSTRGKRNIQNATIISPEKTKRRQKPKIVFTMLDSPLLESLIKHLSGSVVDSVETSTVLVTGQVKRSQKLLTAIGQGKPICSPEWIHASKKANEFLDPWDYILLDQEAEAKWDFSLKESLIRASNEKLLGNYTFQLMVNNAADVLKGAIEACGGKCVPRHPAKNTEGFFVVVASPENRAKYLKIKKQYPHVTVVEPEAIFDGVLRQDLRLGRHLLT